MAADIKLSDCLIAPHSQLYAIRSCPEFVKEERRG